MLGGKLEIMDNKKNILKRSWRTSNISKVAVVCSVLALLLVGSVQAIEDITSIRVVKNTDIYTELTAVEKNTDGRWINSGRELFYINIGGQTYFVGIQAKMMVPYRIEMGQYYSIPIYFTRITPQASVTSIQDIANTDLVTKNDVFIPINVFICGGIVVHSGTNSGSRPGDCFQINIGLYNNAVWTNEIPIMVSPKPTVSSNAVSQNTYVGYDQKIWIQGPDYRFLTDIPVGVWDGPYRITVRIDPISYTPVNEIPLPIQSVTDEVKSDDAITVNDNAVDRIPSAVNGNAVSEDLSKYVEKSNLKVVKTIGLKEIEGKQICQVKGVREAKLLWFIPVNMDVTVNVDTAVGSVETVETPWWGFLTTS